MRAVTVAAVPAQADADPKRASLPRTGQRSNGQPSDLWLVDHPRRLTGAEPPAFRAVGVIGGIRTHDRHALVIGAAVAAWASRGSVYAASMVARTV